MNSSVASSQARVATNTNHKAVAVILPILSILSAALLLVVVVPLLKFLAILSYVNPVAAFGVGDGSIEQTTTAQQQLPTGWTGWTG